MRYVGWVAAISFAIFAPHIGETGSARAEGKPSSKTAAANPLAPHWNHNGSVVSLVAQGPKQKFFYDTPRVGLLDAGVKPGTLLFDGQKSGQNFDGTAYQFYRTCKARGFTVTGSTSDDRKTITLKGKAPLLDMNCNVTGSRDDILVFTVNLTAPTEPPKEVSKETLKETPKETSKETPVTAAAGAKVAAQTPSAVAEVKKPPVVATTVAAPAVPVMPPESNRSNDKTVLEGSNLKSNDTIVTSSAASVATAAKPSEAPKDKQAATTPPPEAIKPSAPAESVKDSAKETAKEHEKQPAATQTALNASNSAAASATPPGEPAKVTPPATVPPAVAAPSKPEVVAAVTNPAEKSTSAPPSEAPKDTQVAAIPATASSAAKTPEKPTEKPAEKPAEKSVDTSKAKTTATAAIVPIPSSLPDKSKADVPKVESEKVPTLVENKTVPTGPPEKMMEIVLKNGRVLRIGRDVELETLSKIIAQLER